MTKNITIYDTTLRDGTQGEGVQVAVEDKLRLTRIFDEVGLILSKLVGLVPTSRC